MRLPRGFNVTVFIEVEVIEASWDGMYIHNLFRRANAIRKVVCGHANRDFDFVDVVLQLQFCSCSSTVKLFRVF